MTSVKSKKYAKNDGELSNEEIDQRNQVRRMNWKWLEENVAEALKSRWVCYSEGSYVVWLKSVVRGGSRGILEVHETICTHDFDMAKKIGEHLKKIPGYQQLEKEVF